MIANVILNLIHNGSVTSEYFPFQKGQKIIYEGEEGKILNVHPFLVVKTATRVACGNVCGLYPKDLFDR